MEEKVCAFFVGTNIVVSRKHPSGKKGVSLKGAFLKMWALGTFFAPTTPE